MRGSASSEHPPSGVMWRESSSSACPTTSVRLDALRQWRVCHQGPSREWLTAPPDTTPHLPLFRKGMVSCPQAGETPNQHSSPCASYPTYSYTILYQTSASTLPGGNLQELSLAVGSRPFKKEHTPLGQAPQSLPAAPGLMTKCSNSNRPTSCSGLRPPHHTGNSCRWSKSKVWVHFGSRSQTPNHNFTTWL